MLPEQWALEGPISDSEFLYLWKTLNFFEELVREEAAEQRVPLEILRVLKECRVCVIFARNSIFCVGSFNGTNDSFRRIVRTEDRRPEDLSVREAERIGVGHIIRNGPADTYTLCFPVRCLDAYESEKRDLLLPIVRSYLPFEVSWAKQRKLLSVPRPFFPGQHFKIDRQLVFVLMPFAAEFEEIYATCIKPTLEKRIARCLRADEIFHNRPIVEIIWKNINEALLVVADLTGRNPNVFYEVGMAHTLGKEVVLVTQDLNDVPFDLRHLLA
jgi:hypothetical protein